MQQRDVLSRKFLVKIMTPGIGWEELSREKDTVWKGIDESESDRITLERWSPLRERSIHSLTRRGRSRRSERSGSRVLSGCKKETNEKASQDADGSERARRVQVAKVRYVDSESVSILFGRACSRKQILYKSYSPGQIGSGFDGRIITTACGVSGGSFAYRIRGPTRKAHQSV